MKSLIVLLALLAASVADRSMAAVERVDIVARSPFAPGVTFGKSGPYEKIRGIAHFSLDSNLPANSRIVDLKRAPRGRARARDVHERVRDAETAEVSAYDTDLRRQQPWQHRHAGASERAFSSKQRSHHCGGRGRRISHAPWFHASVLRLDLGCRAAEARCATARLRTADRTRARRKLDHRPNRKRIHCRCADRYCDLCGPRRPDLRTPRPATIRQPFSPSVRAQTTCAGRFRATDGPSSRLYKPVDRAASDCLVD